MWVGGLVGYVDEIDYVILVDFYVFFDVGCEVVYVVVGGGVVVLVFDDDDVVVVILLVYEIDYVIGGCMDGCVGWCGEVYVGMLFLLI